MSLSFIENISTWIRNLDTKYKIILILLLVIFFRFPTLYTHISDIDESQYSEFAIDLLAGGTPYIDHVGEKPPLMYYYYALSFTIFGENNYLGTHLLTIIWVMISVYFLFLAIRNWLGESIALWSALFYAIYSTTHEPSIVSSNGETLMNLPIILSFWAYIKSRIMNESIKSWIYLGICGVFVGLAMHFRQQGGMQLALIAIFEGVLWLTQLKNDGRLKRFFNLLAKGLILAIGVSIPWVITLTLLYLANALDAFYFWNFTFNFYYVSVGTDSITFLWISWRILMFVVCWLPIWILIIYFISKKFKPIFGSITEIHTNKEYQAIILGIIWLILSFISASLGQRYWTHYFIQLFPAMFLLSGIAFHWLMNKTNFKEQFSKGSRIFLKFTIAYALFFLIIKLNWDFNCWVLDQVSTRITDSNMRISQMVGNFPEQRDIGEYIKAQTKPEDTITVWGFCTPIYHWADRSAAGRFSWTDFLVGKIPGSPIGDDPEIDSWKYRVNGEYADWPKGTPDLWELFMQDLREFKPVYIVDTSTANFHFYGKYPIKNEKYYPQLWDYISKNYFLEINLKGVDLYKRKDY